MRDQILQTAFGRYLVLPVWDAILRLSEPEVRMVTGGIAFYALFSIFPLIYLTAALLFTLLPDELSSQLALAINQIVASNIMPLSPEEVSSVASLAPTSLTLSIVVTLILVMWAVMSGTKATITGIRMIAGSKRRSGERGTTPPAWRAVGTASRRAPPAPARSLRASARPEPPPPCSPTAPSAPPSL